MNELNDKDLEIVVGGRGNSQSNSSSNSNNAAGSSSNSLNSDDLSVRHGQNNGAIIGGISIGQTNDVHQRNSR